MKTSLKILKWLGITLVFVLIFGFIGFLIINSRIESRISKTYEVSLNPLEIPSDSLTLALGKHLSVIKGCTDCHGSNFQGGFVINDPPVGVVYAPNLTKGKGGKIENYTEKDWIRSIKHGVNPTGKALWIMPSYEYDVLSEEDLVALISYVKSREPIDSEPVQNSLGPVGKVLLNFDKIHLLSAEKINHGPKEMVKKVKVEETAAYGQYLITSCIGCHRDDLKGGAPIAPGFPDVPNITLSGKLASYSDEDFIKMMQKGITPEGRQTDAKEMPWSMTKGFTDLEIKAILKYLKSLPDDKSIASKS
ncbi:MAG: cytochrome c [Bacteroidota bacterium]|nr:cytochrome c [Bacteroidota bacterium]